MTTTTFTAPLTLCWTQIKILRWFLPVLILITIIQIVGLGFSNAILQITSAYGAVFTLIATFFVGPVLFGNEYLEGSRDYLQTRPVSPRLIFSIKILFVIGVSFVCTLCLIWGPNVLLFDSNPRECILLFSLFLCIGLWNSGATLITQDLVKGLLTGSLSFIVGFSLLLYLLENVFHLLNTGVLIDFRIQGELFTIHLLALSPLVFFAIASTCYRWQLLRKCSMSWTAIAALLFFLGNGFMAVPYYHREGAASIEFLNDEKESNMLASRRTGDHLLTVEGIFRRNPSVISRRFNGNDLIEEWRSPLPQAQDASWSRGVFFRDRLLLENPNKCVLNLYDLSIPNSPRIIEATLINGGGLHLRYQREEKVIFQRIPRFEDAQHGEEVTEFQIDMTSGEISAVTDLEPFGQVLEKDSEVIFGEGSPYRLKWDGTTKIYRRGEDSGQAVSDLGDIAIWAVKPNTVVGFEYRVNMEQKIVTDYSRLALFDLRNPGSPIKRAIKLPLRFYLPHEELFREYVGSFAGPIGGGYGAIHCGIGKNILIVYSQRLIAVWDIRDLHAPKFIGLADINHGAVPLPDQSPVLGWPAIASYSPYIRNDGALGFLTNDAKILWLEFPALMKEADPS